MENEDAEKDDVKCVPVLGVDLGVTNIETTSIEQVWSDINYLSRDKLFGSRSTRVNVFPGNLANLIPNATAQIDADVPQFRPEFTGHVKIGSDR